MEAGDFRPFELEYLGDQRTSALHVRLSESELRTSVEVDGPTGDSYADFWMSYLRGRSLQFPQERDEIRIADLFCGPGGLSQGVQIGARALGYRVQHQLLVDVDKGALDVASFNHRPQMALNVSTASLVDFQVRSSSESATFQYPPQLIDESAASVAGEIDVLIAGPPCQGHSTANKNRRNFDQRNLLYLTVPALAIAWGVPTVIIENVPAVKASQQGVVQTTYRLFREYGYSVTEGVINAADFGWPQARRRYFMIASRDRNIGGPIKRYFPSIGMRSALPISVALGDLIDAGGSDFMTMLPDLSDDNRNRIRILHESSDHDLPMEHRNEKARIAGTTYPSVYGKMYWDRPAQTLTTGFMTPGRGRYVHPLRQRTLLPREAARLQGFPDSYRFDAFGELPARTALARWIGDAVPAPLGFAAALVALASESLTLNSPD